MAFTKLTKDMNIIQKLDDEPNDVGGLTSAELKAKFDEPANAVKDWINRTFIPEAERELKNALLGQIDLTVIAPPVIGAASGHNLLDNGYFPDPVNQRGKTEYTGAGYCIDRWRMITNQTQKFTVAAGECVNYNSGKDATYKRLTQFVEGATYRAGCTYTLSMLCRVNGFGGAVYLRAVTSELSAISGGGVKVDAVGEQVFSVTFTPTVDFQNAGAELFVYNTAEDYIDVDIYAVKLELSSVQTLAHQGADGSWMLNDPPPNKQQELAKCQRYMQVLSSYSSAGYSIFGTGVVTAEGKCRILIPLTTSMRRAVPTVTMTGSFEILYFNSSGTVSKGVTYASVVSTESGICITLTIDSGDAVVGAPCLLREAGATKAQIILDNNL